MESSKRKSKSPADKVKVFKRLASLKTGKTKRELTDCDSIKYSRIFTATPFYTIWSALHKNPSSMRILDKNWTAVVEKFGNPTSFVFHLANSVIKLKYDPG
ncbi:hypothetical protein AVEN_216455-1 [Araneus ventricosus]|uniref:Uncharacterized protein n=1 Tax=Araneus ventricosus TaxID=182803 RepID=A0A4Y2BLH0_ARAVE|nr:hypothetical protein AVEN_216455-1 [Araneus ventricosus]